MSQVRSQRVAQAAFERVSSRVDGGAVDKLSNYRSFAQAFPTLIHTCGLAQATAFARAKGEEQGEVLEDLARVLSQRNGETLHEAAIGQGAQATEAKAALMSYLKLSRDALFAATWIKRYAEALITPKAEK